MMDYQTKQKNRKSVVYELYYFTRKNIYICIWHKYDLYELLLECG